MPGPLVHRAVALEVRKLLKGRFPVRVRIADYMAPDIAELQHPGTHPGYNAVTGTGNLVITVMDAIGVARNIGATSRNLLVVSHLIADAHMVTQVVPELVKWDDFMDVAAEAVPDKRKLCYWYPNMVGGVTEFERRLRESIRFTYTYFGPKLQRCGKQRFAAKHLDEMTRRCVAQAAHFTAWAAQEAGI